jgi:hypothetical protein
VDVGKALDWANKAYSSDPNSATSAAILAYSLVMNEQMEWAKPLIENYERNQIAELALGQIQLAQAEAEQAEEKKEEKRKAAIEILKAAIARDPGSLEAERAKEILAQHDAEYIPPAAPGVILEALKSRFGQTIIAEFIGPEKMISVQLNTRGNKFPYDSEFDGTIAITNNSARPLVIGDDGLFTGNIRIDANVSGDLNKHIPNLISVKIQPASPVKPERSIFFPMQLVTGELKQILLGHPQASLDIEFTAYLDPITTDDGKIANRIRSIEPVKAVVKRPAIELTTKYLQNRVHSLTKGQQGQKIKTAQLFIGLLMEQHAMAGREPPYRFRYADWMPTTLKSALLHNLTRDDWVVKAHIIAGMLPLALDHQLINGVAENLNDTHWPIRMMAMYVLAKKQNQNFGKVLDWAAKYDSNKLVRDMAFALRLAPYNPQTPTPANLLELSEPEKLLQRGM